MDETNVQDALWIRRFDEREILRLPISHNIKPSTEMKHRNFTIDSYFVSWAMLCLKDVLKCHYSKVEW